MVKELEVRYDRENGWIELTYSGEWNLRTVTEAAKELIPVLGEYACRRFLNDSSHAKVNLSRPELELLPGILETGGMDRSWKRAIVASSHLDDFHYYEKAAQKEGFAVKVFTDIGEAREWLRK
jgi:hypothetical protein